MGSEYGPISTMKVTMQLYGEISVSTCILLRTRTDEEQLCIWPGYIQFWEVLYDNKEIATNVEILAKKKIEASTERRKKLMR